MSDISDRLVVFGGSLSGIIAAYLYALYRNKYEAAAEIKKAESVQLGEELESRLRSSDTHSIPYASVEGVVSDLGKTFSSKYSSKRGVILQTSRVEHKSQRIHGFWTDAKNVLRDTFDVAPFAIQDPEQPKHYIIVSEAAEAEELLESLEVIHDDFIHHKSSAVQTGIDRLFGEVRHGVHETEEMLVVGTGLVGIGEILLEDGRLKLCPPQVPNAHYFLTRMSRGQLMRHIQTQASSLRVAALVFGAVTLGLVTFLLWRLGKKYLDHRKMQHELEEIRRSTLRRHAEARVSERQGKSSQQEENLCVVCLCNPREVVTLDCGHISMCCDCAEMLPTPQKCPVCRNGIQRFLPLYRP